MEEYILKPFNELKQAIDDFVNNKIKANDLKHTTAGFGIYLQRNKLMMIRIRITAGELSISELEHIRLVMNRYDVPYLRVTTRENLQLHDVEPKNANNILDDLADYGFVFRGGGGDTFRSIPVSYDSGISADSVFDVVPYAEELSKKLYPVEKAFHLPRKIKIAISSDSNDSAFAKWQDIGFIAVNDESGNKGFRVYIGGGMGRKSKKAIKVFDFLSAEDLLRSVIAMIDLFEQYGNREDRSKARIRFIRERFGDNSFKELYMDFFSKTVADKLIVERKKYFNSDLDLVNEIIEIDNEQYLNWKKIFVDRTSKNDFSLVRIPILSGNMNQSDISFFMKMLKEYSVKFIRINRVHEICVVMSNYALKAFYSELSQHKENDFSGKNFKGHILSCVGAKTCPLGLIDSQDIAIKIGEILDNGFKQYKSEIYRKVINNISVCGCGNSCGNPEVFKISVIGSKKKIDGNLTEIYKLRYRKFSENDMDNPQLIEVSNNDFKEKFIEVINHLAFN